MKRTKLKKIIVMLFTAALFACLGILSACGDPEYYLLTFEEVKGVVYESGDLKTGAKVKEGYVVGFTVTFDPDCTGEATVLANDDALTADANGVYSFAMKRDTVVKVTGVSVPNEYEVKFDKGGYRVSYESENGDAETGFSVSAGEEVRFTVDVSVYYKEDYRVLANTTVLTPDEHGVYSVRVTEDTNVSMYKLEEDDGFIGRTGTGSGTAEDPYQISRPIDLYYMASLINNDFFAGSGYYAAHYRLMNDIDMKGEQLFVIGDTYASTAYFCGTFDGGGHTIRNYYMTDTVVDQEEFIELSLPYVGLFGCAAALTDAPAQIYNLNLENFTITAKAYGDGDQMFAAGAFVGYGMGVNIVGCSASGTIIGDADYGYYSYMGGIIGVQQSVYQSQTVRHYSEVRSCVSDVRVSAQSGYVFAAGGITGNLITYESHTPAYVVNSYATGDVGGAIHAGGVVGYASEGTAIENCYATGDVEAQNKIGVTIGYEAESRAFAGGIVGYCEENSVVAYCFYPRTSTVYAYARAGKDYAFADPICGGKDSSGTKSVDSEAAVLIENRTDVTAGTPASYIRSWLKWSDADWILTDDAYPTVNHADSHTTITVTIARRNAVSDKTVTSGTLQDRYVPMSHWYLERNGVSEYVTYDGKRSFGYYFDNALTQKVPDCYIPMSDVTLYAGFADYNAVAGTYYLVAERGGAVSVRLNADGTMVYRDGALNQTSAYVYDGNRLYLYDTCFFYLREDLTEDEIAYTTFLGTVNADGSLTLSDLTYFPAETPLFAVKEIAFGYGEYYGASSEYAFYRDGTGEKDGTAFTYTLNGTVLTVRIGGATLTGAYGSDGTITIGGETLTKYDAFRGTWEKSATSYRSYTFDGKGNWTSRSYATENGIATERTQSGTYTADEDTITLNDGTIVGFKDGFLQVKGTDGLVQTYYRESSFAGAWRFHNASNPIVATLNGIGTDGFGTAVLDYNNGNYTVELTYETVAVQGARAICFYLYDSFYGTLVYNSETRVLSGELYSPVKQAFVAANFCVYDDFYGVWVSEIEGIDTIEFNGLGLYNLPGSQTSMPVRGTVKINGQAVGSYAVVGDTLEGSFTYLGTEYKITYLESGSVRVVYGVAEEKLLAFDEWKDAALVGQDGELVYTVTFDGRGNLPNGGTMTVLCGSVQNGYRYRVADGTVVSVDSDFTLTENTDTDEWILTAGGLSVALTYRNGFTGEWLIGGRYNRVSDGSGVTPDLVVGKIGASLTATGSYLGQTVRFTYEDGILSFEWEGASMYVYTVGWKSDPTVFTANELSIGRGASANSAENSMCVSLSSGDGRHTTTYTLELGNGSIAFDGLGKSRYGTGKAIAVTDGVTKEYTYRVDETVYLGALRLTDGTKTYLFLLDGLVREDRKEDGVRYGASNGSTYYLIKADFFYALKAKDDAGTTYLFDGIGRITAADALGTISYYSYEYGGRDANTGYYKLELTDESGTKFSALCNYAGKTLEILSNSV